MPQDMTTFCLIGLGVGFLILLAGLLLVQVLRGSVFGLGMILMRVFTETKEEPPSAAIHNVDEPPTSDDLRARAQALDFDAAVAKYRQGQQEPPANPNPVPPPNIHPAPDQPYVGDDPNNGVLPQ